jgi:pyruvate/2-oxoglutarate dehydrogenase complex dihydrolipoamide dehydrogenase (E3) component
MNAERFDAVIIGTGQSGKPLAGALGRAGWKIAIVERRYVGGTCINVGCTPTKTMVASARVAYLARRGPEYGVHGDASIRVDMAEVRARKQKIVEQFRNGGERSLVQAPNVDLIFGEASFVDARTVRVALNAGGERFLTAAKIVVNTGGRPAKPPIPGLAAIEALDSSSIMELETLPGHLVVLGGGYIGLEFSQMFRRYGARVTVIARDDRLIAREDPDVSAEVEKVLADDGVAIVKNASIARITRASDVHVDLDTPAGARQVTGTHLLLALGRTPNTEMLTSPQPDFAPTSAGTFR